MNRIARTGTIGRTIRIGAYAVIGCVLAKIVIGAIATAVSFIMTAAAISLLVFAVIRFTRP